MNKISYLLLLLIFISGIAYSEEDKVKIIQENGYYCTQLENGEKFQIVRQWEPQAPNKVVLSPDGQYVAYTTNNFLGLESEGRDVYYCRIDGSERTFLHKYDFVVDTLLWDSYGEKDFVFVTFMECQGIQIIELQSKNQILNIPGDSLVKIQGTDCYQIFCNGKPGQQGKRYGKPVEKERQRICLEELLTIKEPDSLNVRFYTSWGNSDIYISTQREPVLKLSDLPALAEQVGVKFRDFVGDRYFYVSNIVPTPENNLIAFIGEIVENLYFFGIFDVERRKLLLLDCGKGQEYLNSVWSLDGSRLAVLNLSHWGSHIIFYEFKEQESIVPIKSYNLGHRMASDYRWSEDGSKFYFSYESGNQKVEEQIDLSR